MPGFTKSTPTDTKRQAHLTPPYCIYVMCSSSAAPIEKFLPAALAFVLSIERACISESEGECQGKCQGQVGHCPPRCVCGVVGCSISAGESSVAVLGASSKQDKKAAKKIPSYLFHPRSGQSSKHRSFRQSKGRNGPLWIGF